MADILFEGISPRPILCTYQLEADLHLSVFFRSQARVLMQYITHGVTTSTSSLLDQCYSRLMQRFFTRSWVCLRDISAMFDRNNLQDYRSRQNSAQGPMDRRISEHRHIAPLKITARKLP